MKKITLTLIYILFFSTSLNLFSETLSDKAIPTLIIADFKGTSVDSTLLKLLNDTFTEAIHKTKKFILVNRDEVERIMKEAKFQQTGMCDSTSCYAEIGSALGAEKMMIGDVVKFENVFRVQVKLIDISKIIEEKIESFTCVYDVSMLLGNISDLAFKLSGVQVSKTIIEDKITTKPKEEAYGSIKIVTEPDNAEFYLDGKLLGRTPATFKNVSVGKHSFAIKLEGYEEIENDISVVKGKAVEISQRLSPVIVEEKAESMETELINQPSNEFKSIEQTESLNENKKEEKQSKKRGEIGLGVGVQDKSTKISDNQINIGDAPLLLAGLFVDYYLIETARHALGFEFIYNYSKANDPLTITFEGLEPQSKSVSSSLQDVLLNFKYKLSIIPGQKNLSFIPKVGFRYMRFKTDKLISEKGDSYSPYASSKYMTGSITPSEIEYVLPIFSNSFDIGLRARWDLLLLSKYSEDDLVTGKSPKPATINQAFGGEIFVNFLESFFIETGFETQKLKVKFTGEGHRKGQDITDATLKENYTTYKLLFGYRF